MSSDFYKKSSPSIDYYGSYSSYTEPNMRQELINTLDGKFPEVAKSQPGLLRKMNRDSNGKLIKCPCVDDVTKEPDKDRLCPICLSEAYLWSEENITFYKTLKSSDIDNALRDKQKEPGLINLPIIVFYIRYNVGISIEDKIITLDLDESGDKKVPTRRNGVFRINALWDYRSDNGKLEYWKAFTHKEFVRYLNVPSYGDL